MNSLQPMALKRRHDSKMMYGDGKMSRTRRESPTLNGDSCDMICNSRGGSSDLKIFIPILDTVAKHWILAVVKVSYGDCEIWDSNPEVAAEQRRKDYVIAVVNNFDSGICVIRNMQFYDQRWHEGFNSGDQRMRIALEIVNSPLNECRDAVWESVYQEQKNVSNSRNIPGSDTTDPLLIRAGMKFKPRVPRR